MWRTLVSVLIGVAGGIGLIVALLAFGVRGRGTLLAVIPLALVLVAPLVLLALVHWWVLPSQGLTGRAIGWRTPSRPMWALLWIIPVQLLLGIVGVGLLSHFLLGGATSTRGTAATLPELHPVTAVAIVVGMVLVTPWVEETVFRGIVLGWLRGLWPNPGAIVASAGIFTLAHGVEVPAMPSRLTLGLFSGWLRVRYESLVPGLIMHMVQNGLVAAVGLAALSSAG